MTEATEDKATILVVDDSRLMRVAARKILKNDFDILEAGDGEQAWEALQGEQGITLVMSDLSMPNLDGLGLLKRIRESTDDALRTLPVIIVTGAEDDDGSKNTALSAGASDFITKPFESVQLLARAKTHARQKQTQQALRESETHTRALEEQNRIDALTGLVNRQGFDNHIEEALSYAARHRTELALLTIRIEKYKVLFLRRGKPVAEDVLRRIASTLGHDRRREDIVGRIGLDTFGVLLPSANPIGARRVAEQLHQKIQDLDFSVDGDPVEVKTSFAVVCPALLHESRVETFHEEAEAQLTQALQAGGNRVHHGKDTHGDGSEIPDDTAAAIDPLAVASIADVEIALQAISHGRPVRQDAATLARAVLPLLQHWNTTCDKQHSDLLQRLEAVLGGTSQTPLSVDLSSTR